MGTIFVDATHAAKTGARTGAQTVVRGLLSGLSQCAVDFQIMRWSKWRDRLLPLTPNENHRLAVIQLGERVRPPSRVGSWLLLPEIIYGDRVLRVMHYARRRKFRVAAIFHDAIPISHSHLVRHEAVKWHAHYMKALCGADLVIAVSDFAAGQFRAFAQHHRQRLPRLTVCRLSGVDRPEALLEKGCRFLLSGKDSLRFHA